MMYVTTHKLGNKIKRDLQVNNSYIYDIIDICITIIISLKNKICDLMHVSIQANLSGENLKRLLVIINILSLITARSCFLELSLSSLFLSMCLYKYL